MELPPFPRTGTILLHPANKIFLWIAAIATIIEFTIFKCVYPSAGFLNGDSYLYLQTATFNLDISTYPVGYAKFLRIFSTFSHSDIALVAFQYFAIEATALLLLFTLFNYFAPRRFTRWTMFALTVFNPVFLYVSNYVSSDALFISLSLLWFTSLVRLIRQPTVKTLIVHILLLFYVFTVRYNALWYPLISIIGLLLTRQSVPKKLAAILLVLAPVGGYIYYNQTLYYQAIGVRQFTPFSGWQLANNALYAYRYVDSGMLATPPGELQQLDRMVRHYFDTSKDLRRHPSEMLRASTVYMWDPQSPLQKFMNVYTQRDSAAGFFKRWALMGPLYTKYGSWLISRYPAIYWKFYLLQNAFKFYAPPGEFLDEYNMGRDTVAAVAQTWFHYKTQKVAPAVGGYKVSLLGYMPILCATVNILFLLGYLGLLCITGLSLRTPEERLLLTVFCLWICNFFFSVIAAPVTLRYQLFYILVTTFFAMLILERLYLLSFPKVNSPRSG
jgi:hypothetical protein